MESSLCLGKSPTSIEQRSIALAQVLSKGYISIAEVDLRTGIAAVLQSQEDTELEGHELPWSSLLQRYATRRTYPGDQNLVLSLTAEYLEAFLQNGNREHSLEVRCATGTTNYIWVEIGIVALSVSEKKLLITTRSVNEDRIMRRIVDMYVFEDMDYFVLLDTVHDSYTMFSSRQHSLPIPSMYQKTYTEEMLRYNKQYVAPEDEEWVTANMQIPHILAMLEKETHFSFFNGCITDEGAYRRVRVQYQYYDRSMGLVLFTRTDVTEIFLEEQAKHKLLAAALRDAQHDALTDIYNQKATAELIAGSLESQYGSQAAFLFVDVDNFKMVNDTLGHQTGDKLLRFLASSIQNLAGRDGIAGRVGGDEFLLFIPADSGIEAVKRYAQRICQVFDSLPGGLSENLPISCSVGISLYPKDGTDYDTLVRKADQALYISKRYGKNMYYFYSHEPPTQK